MISHTNVLFVNSQALKEDGMWLYKFRFLTHALTKSDAKSDFDKLCKARLNLLGIVNTKNQHYYLCEESSNFDSTPNKRRYVSRIDEILSGSVDTVISNMKDSLKLAVRQRKWPKVASWKWSSSSTSMSSEKYKTNKISDFERRAFFREWELVPTKSMSQYWEIKIEVPPKENVAFIFSYDIWNCSGEKLAGTPIICKINAPVELTDSNNYKGVSFDIKKKDR